MTPQLIFEWVSVAALLGALFFFVAAVRSMFGPKERDRRIDSSNVVIFKKRTISSKVLAKEKLDAWKRFKDSNSGGPTKPDGDGTK